MELNFIARPASARRAKQNLWDVVKSVAVWDKHSVTLAIVTSRFVWLLKFNESTARLFLRIFGARTFAAYELDVCRPVGRDSGISWMLESWAIQFIWHSCKAIKILRAVDARAFRSFHRQIKSSLSRGPSLYRMQMRDSKRSLEFKIKWNSGMLESPWRQSARDSSRWDDVATFSLLTVSPKTGAKKNSSRKGEKEPAWWSWRCFFSITKKKKARDGWKHQDVCLVILFFTAFHFERRKMRLKVQVIHISNSHQRFLWLLQRASEMTGKKRRKIALSRSHSRHFLFFDCLRVQFIKFNPSRRDERDSKLLLINRTMASKLSLDNGKSTYFIGDVLWVLVLLGFGIYWWLTFGYLWCKSENGTKLKVEQICWLKSETPSSLW